MTDEEYEVECVNGRRIRHGITQYLLKWKNYNEQTWTPFSECGSCKRLIDDYEKKHPPAQATTTPMPTTVTRARSTTKTQSNTKESESTPTTGRNRSQRHPSGAEKRDSKSPSEDSEEEKDDAPGTSQKIKKRPARMSVPLNPSKQQPTKRGRSSKGEDGDDSESEGESKSTKTSTSVKKAKVDVSASVKTRASLAGNKTSFDLNAENSEDKKDSAVETTTGRRSGRRGQNVSDGGLIVSSAQRNSDDPATKLDDALISLLTSEPYIPFTRPGNQLDAKKGDAIVIRMPPKILKSEDVPRIEVCNEKTYKDKGHKITAPNGGVEVFNDRRVVNIVGYVPDKTHPFVLVKLDWKTNETELRVKEAVQAVHCPLAEKLFPKIYKTYMDRVTRRSQPPSGSGDGAGPSGSTAGTSGSSDVAGPSGAATPATSGIVGRRTRRSVD